jgi:adenylate cyclase
MKTFESRLLETPILAVDDREENLLLLEELLRQRGYTNVTCTSDPFQVAPLHQQKQFGLILLDMQMPRLDGIGVIQQLRQQAPDPFLPVLVITAASDDELRLRALSAGARDYVTKPFAVAELAQRIRNLLEVELAYRDRQQQTERLETMVRERTRELQESENELERKVQLRTAELVAEQQKTNELLTNILPEHVIAELRATGKVKPAEHRNVTILFTDFADFTQTTATMPADRMVAELNEIFAAFDRITYEEGVEKIKTIGDAYMAASGLSDDQGDHAVRCVRSALRMQDFITQRNSDATFKWNLRIGLHSGPIISGVVGQRKYGRAQNPSATLSGENVAWEETTSS